VQERDVGTAGWPPHLVRIEKGCQAGQRDGGHVEAEPHHIQLLAAARVEEKDRKSADTGWQPRRMQLYADVLAGQAAGAGRRRQKRGTEGAAAPVPAAPGPSGRQRKWGHSHAGAFW
jgi:hypothetical protein